VSIAFRTDPDSFKWSPQGKIPLTAPELSDGTRLFVRTEGELEISAT
jgi:hypothetical protein